MWELPYGGNRQQSQSECGGRQYPFVVPVAAGECNGQNQPDDHDRDEDVDIGENGETFGDGRCYACRAALGVRLRVDEVVQQGSEVWHELTSHCDDHRTDTHCDE
jgi:hypothetical protein